MLGTGKGHARDRLETRQGQAMDALGTGKGHARDRLGTTQGHTRDNLVTCRGQPRDIKANGSRGRGRVRDTSGSRGRGRNEVLCHNHQSQKASFFRRKSASSTAPDSVTTINLKKRVFTIALKKRLCSHRLDRLCNAGEHNQICDVSLVDIVSFCRKGNW